MLLIMGDTANQDHRRSHALVAAQPGAPDLIGAPGGPRMVIYQCWSSAGKTAV
jgi:hypothetical protein